MYYISLARYFVLHLSLVWPLVYCKEKIGGWPIYDFNSSSLIKTTIEADFQ